MNDQSTPVLQFLKGQEISQIAFGMYDLQINWGDGGLSCTGRVIYTPTVGGEVVWTEGHPFDAVPLLRLLQQTIETFDGSSEGELKLQFSNGDRLTVARDDGPEGFTIHQVGQGEGAFARVAQERPVGSDEHRSRKSWARTTTLVSDQEGRPLAQGGARADLSCAHRIAPSFRRIDH